MEFVRVCVKFNKIFEEMAQWMPGWHQRIVDLSVAIRLMQLYNQFMNATHDTWWFEANRPEQYRCSQAIQAKLMSGYRAVLVCAPVKSGKREVAQILALKDHIGSKGGMARTHFFLTSLNRRDSAPQLEEHKAYGLIAKTLDTKKTVRDLIHTLESIDDPTKVVVHFDESDYGTGNGQLFSRVFPKLQEQGMSFVGYSATNEEALFSDFGKSAARVTFIPHSNYRGAGYFLDENLVFDSNAFYEANCLTTQAQDALKYWVDSRKD